MGKVTKECPQCGKVFQVYPSVKQECCSTSCSLRYRPRKPKRGTETPCEVCGAPVYANQSERAKGAGRFCSYACHNVAQTKEPVVKGCATCGKELRLKPSQAQIQYCSKACEAAARTKRPLEWEHNGKTARKTADGYVMVYEPTHPNKAYKGFQFEHRLVVEAALGRYLESYEVVHHINGVKDDNRLENLEVMDALDHAVLSSRDFRESMLQRFKELAEYRERYGPLPKE